MADDNVRHIEIRWARGSPNFLHAQLQAASLDEMLTNARYSARVVHFREGKSYRYRYSRDGTFSVRLQEPRFEEKVRLMIEAYGFEIVPARV